MLVASPRLHEFNEATRNFTYTAHQTYEIIKVVGAKQCSPRVAVTALLKEKARTEVMK